MPQPWARNGLVAALGVKTVHWGHISATFPGILNCCIDVRRAFNKEWDESTAGSGFDQHTRDRMMAKETWDAVFQVALCILWEFGLLIVICNHGKHRSLSVAYEVAIHTRSELVSIRNSAFPRVLRQVCDVMKDFGGSLRRHCELFGERPHPVLGIHLCRCRFDGDAWAAGECAEYRSCRYLNLKGGDILVEIECERDAAQGWALGFPVGGRGRPGWYPPEYVTPLPRGHFRRCRNFHQNLIPTRLQGL